MRTLLSFDSAPPLAAPLRFFLTAPLFAVLAGLLLALDGGDALASRWTPSALALTHLLTVGFMLQAMFGAALQVLPVIARATPGQPLLIARVVHPLSLAGALALVAGLRWGNTLAIESGAVLLSLAVVVFIVGIRVLFRTRSSTATIRGLKLAFVALVVTTALGGLLAFALTRAWPLELGALTDLHAGWGLGGWAAGLLAAVAYVVVPMFQLTPRYPERVAWVLPLAIISVLVVWGTAAIFGPSWLVSMAQLALCTIGIAFALLTLWLQLQHRRGRVDATYRYWQSGMLSSVFALLMVAGAVLVPGLARSAAWAPAAGVLLIVGGFVAFISGMLYKIVPFLAWLHLQKLAQTRVPSMDQFLRHEETLPSWIAHVLALLALVAATVLPVLATPAGLAFAISSAWLGGNLLRVVRRYRRCVTSVEQGRAAPAHDRGSGGAAA